MPEEKNAPSELVAKGNLLTSAGRFDEAVSAFDKALEENPRYAEAWNNRGIALVNANMVNEALKSFEKAGTWIPSTPMPGITWAWS